MRYESQAIKYWNYIISPTSPVVFDIIKCRVITKQGILVKPPLLSQYKKWFITSFWSCHGLNIA